MNSTNIKSNVLTAIAVAATVATSAGCASWRNRGACPSETAYAPAPAPVQGAGAEAMGAPPPAIGTSEGAATSEAQNVPAQGNVVIPLQREQLNVSKQQVPGGNIVVRKEVTTRTESVPVQVREESVTVNKVPGGAPAGNTALNTPFQAGQINIPLVREEPVVTKQVVPNGTVVINRQQTTRTVNAQGEVRSEDVATTPNCPPQGAMGAAPAEAGAAGGAAAGGATAGGATITDWNQLNDPATATGKQVNLSNAKVDRVISDNLIEVKSDTGKTFFVHSTQPAPGLQPGQTVSLNGTFQQAPSDPTTMGWDPASAQAIQGHHHVIEVQSLTPAPQQ